MDNQLRISFICRIIGCRGLGYCLHISDIQLAWLPEIGETFLKDSFAKAPLAYSVTLAVLSLLLCLFENRMGTGNRVSLLYLGEAVDHGLYDRLLQCVAAAQAQRRTAAKCGRAGLLENSKDGGLKHLTTTNWAKNVTLWANLQLV